jgi:catechol 2,3-dioxygenase-like lactoylglutathione lyase family enzyme
MIRHVASIAEIVDDFDAAVGFYRDRLGLPVEVQPGGGYAVVKVAGVLHFGIWERAHAAGAVFGDAAATARVPLGFSLGFEVDGVDEAADALAGRGVTLVQGPHDEPWGQRTARFPHPSGALVEVSETPAARRASGPEPA